ncbi:hypothetical protein ABFV55_27950, partial [Pseudomonas syringae]|uniref:hypothetical protein n=1 Tax=Pseudomonas syringae TaxID=317 RepID=UPI0034D97130
VFLVCGGWVVVCLWVVCCFFVGVGGGWGFFWWVGVLFAFCLWFFRWLRLPVVLFFIFVGGVFIEQNVLVQCVPI